MRQILRIALSKHKTLEPIANYIATLAMLITLALALGDVFGSTFLYAGLIISAVFGAFILWIYFPKRTVGKRKQSLNEMVKRSSIATVILFIISCITEGLGVYFLFQIGYLWGNYDMIIELAKEFSVRLPPFDQLNSLYHSVAMSLFSIAEGTIGFAVVGYSYCLNRWARWKL